MSGEDESSNVVRFRPGSRASARIKRLPEGDGRRGCRHAAVWIWESEPVVECRDCGATVDPYQWIRAICWDWDHVIEDFERRKKEAKREVEAVKAELRRLRGEYANERERREAERAIATLPPPRRTRT